MSFIRWVRRYLRSATTRRASASANAVHATTRGRTSTAFQMPQQTKGSTSSSFHVAEAIAMSRPVAAWLFLTPSLVFFNASSAVLWAVLAVDLVLVPIFVLAMRA